MPGIVFLFLFVMLPTASWADEPKWKQHTKGACSEFEAAGVFDVDHDGKLDIVFGDTWYEAPGWKPHRTTSATCPAWEPARHGSIPKSLSLASRRRVRSRCSSS